MVVTCEFTQTTMETKQLGTNRATRATPQNNGFKSASGATPDPRAFESRPLGLSETETKWQMVRVEVLLDSPGGTPPSPRLCFDSTAPTRTEP